MRLLKIKQVIDFRFQAELAGKSSGRTQVQLVNFYKSQGAEKGKFYHVMFRLSGDVQLLVPLFLRLLFYLKQ